MKSPDLLLLLFLFPLILPLPLLVFPFLLTLHYACIVFGGTVFITLPLINVQITLWIRSEIKLLICWLTSQLANVRPQNSVGSRSIEAGMRLIMSHNA